MKLIQYAKFVAGAGGHTEPSHWADNYGSPHRSLPVIQPAILDIEGLMLHSPTPKSAAEAERINMLIEKWQRLPVS